MGFPEPQGLYDPRNEHDACGVGFVAHIKGEKNHAIITQALEILKNIDHRGAVGADPLLGDGAGILIQLPDALYRDWATGEGLTLPQPGDYAVAMCFLPQDAASREFIVSTFEKFIEKEGQKLIGWRDVPVTIDGLGKAVLESMPVIRQCFVGRGENCDDQDAFERKILAPAEIARACARLPRPLVFTNGVFDILHRGHVTYLARARALGASLLVALNGDASARRLGKGPGRPLNALEDRLALVAALECVDAVTWFDEDTPAALIDACRPEVLVKGGDWPVERIVGAPQVLARGGAVHSIPFEHQRSTTALLRRIENRGSRVSPLPAPSEAAARRRSRPASGSPSKRRAAQSRARGRGRSR